MTKNITPSKYPESFHRPVELLHKFAKQIKDITGEISIAIASSLSPELRSEPNVSKISVSETASSKMPQSKYPEVAHKCIDYLHDMCANFKTTIGEITLALVPTESPMLQGESNTQPE